MSERKPFPKPPNFNSPIGDKAPVPTEEDFDPNLSDDATMLLLKQYLRPDQLADKRIVKFILSYVTCRSAGDAAEAAGWARARGSYWRSRPEIHAVIEAITTIAVMKHGYDASEMIERAKEIAVCDPIEMQNLDGSYKAHLSDVKPEVRRAIKKLKVKNIYGVDANGMPIIMGQIIDYEFWDKMKGIELLGSEKNIFKKTTVVQHDVTANMAGVLLESGKRADERKLIMAREVSNAGTEEERGDRASGWDSDGVPVAVGGSQSLGHGPIHDLSDVSGEEEPQGNESPL